jgi:LuxR family maltose regulon positive regulatory protein
LLSNRPILCFFQVWALLLSGQVDRAQAAFEALAEQPEHSAGQITLLRAFLKLSQGDLTGATNLGRQALATLDKDDLFWRGFSNWIFSTFHLMEAGEISQSSAALADLARLSRESGHLMVTVAVLNQLGALYVRQAKLRQAQETYEEALALATSERGELLPVAGEALMGLGELWREWNHLEQAGQYLQDGIALTDRWREAAAYPGLISLARVRQAQGNPPAANSAMRQARERTAQFDPVSGLGPYVASHQAQLWLLQGDIDRAVQWAVDAGLFLNESGNLTQNSGLNDPAQDDNLVTYHLRKYEYMALSRLLLAQKRPAAALALLDPLLQQMERQGRTGMIIEGLVLKALALRAQDKPDQALIVLEEALSLAAAGGYVRLFVDEDIPLARLLGQRPKNPDAPHINDYVRQLRLAFGLAGTQLPSQAVQPLVEPLSERELDVLRLMVTGLKYKEIAARLHISLNTVRHHVKNLYRKLDVNSRTRAVARAQDLGLL